MSGSTSIHDLPTDPTGGGNITNNISLNATEIPNPSPSTSLTLDQTTISQIVSGIQQASASGATLLPSRDIPRSVEQDPQVQVNYIPPTQQKDYVKEYETASDILDNYNKNARQTNTLDEIYDELQIPLLLAVLFFFFQLPIFKKKMFNFLPFLFFKDGNYNIQGYIFTSTLFGLFYYLLSKIMGHFNKF